MRTTRAAVMIAFATFSSVCVAGEVPDEPSMVLIEGGSYPIGSADGPASARPPHRVTLDPFLIDVYEVTNAQFVAFLNTLEVTAKRDVRAGELRPDDVEGPDADRLWGGNSGNDRAFIEMDDTDARIGIVDERRSRWARGIWSGLKKYGSLLRFQTNENKDRPRKTNPAEESTGFA